MNLHIICFTGYEAGNCSYLDVRLTFRSADSSGLVEICNDEGVWSIACSSAFEEDEKAVACRQLGFNAPIYFADLESIVIPHTETKPTFSENLNCGNEETSLVQCLFFGGRRRKRGLNDISPIGETTCNQASVKCGGNCSSYNVIYKEYDLNLYRLYYYNCSSS